MKKIRFFRFFVLIVIVFFTFSCNKNEVATASNLNPNNQSEGNLKQNEATWITTSECKGILGWLKIKFSVGHTVDDCGGKCVMVFGQFGHIDCRGFGYVCNHTAKAKIVENGGVIKLVLEDPEDLGEELEFLFPDRALLITNPQNNTDLWLNIPEQLLMRNNINVPFEILDIWFSEEPELENK